MIFYLATEPGGRERIVGTQADARAVSPSFVQTDVPTDKAGLMAYVQDLMDKAAEAPAPDPEPDAAPSEEAPPPPCPPVPPPVPYTQRSLDIDEIFENLPLAHQLHLAALAMENARSRLK